MKRGDKSPFTIILMPQGVKGKQRTFQISRKSLRIIIGVGIVLFFVFFTIFADYIGVKSKTIFLKKLKEDNKHKAQKILNLEETVDDLNKKINKFEEYKRKLNIIAGLESDEALQEVGMGSTSSIDIGEQEIESGLNENKITEKNNLREISKIKDKASQIEENLEFMYNYFKEQQKILSSTPSIWPTRGYISSTFGYRNDPFTGKREFHPGLDISTRLGNKIIAPADGIVVESSTKRGYGNYITIYHNYGYKTIYAHLQKRLVKRGDKVERGDLIGLVGSTGKSTAAHLHYEVRVHNKPVDPLDYILENDWLFRK